MGISEVLNLCNIYYYDYSSQKSDIRVRFTVVRQNPTIYALHYALMRYCCGTRFKKKIAVSKTNQFLEFFAVVFGEFIDVLLVIT